VAKLLGWIAPSSSGPKTHQVCRVRKSFQPRDTGKGLNCFEKVLQSVSSGIPSVSVIHWKTRLIEP
jgi:hypothetical protein